MRRLLSRSTEAVEHERLQFTFNLSISILLLFIISAENLCESFREPYTYLCALLQPQPGIAISSAIAHCSLHLHNIHARIYLVYLKSWMGLPTQITF